MNAAVIYFSRTGNTKRLAQDIANSLNVPISDLASTSALKLQSVDLLIFGSPVEGGSPAKEAVVFLDALPQVNGKKAIVFCTCRLFGNYRTNNNMEKKLRSKGYDVVLKVSKKGLMPEDKKTTFSDVVNEVKKAVASL